MSTEVQGGGFSAQRLGFRTWRLKELVIMEVEKALSANSPSSPRGFCVFNFQFMVQYLEFIKLRKVQGFRFGAGDSGSRVDGSEFWIETWGEPSSSASKEDAFSEWILSAAWFSVFGSRFVGWIYGVRAQDGDRS